VSEASTEALHTPTLVINRDQYVRALLSHLLSQLADLLHIFKIASEVN
jgi:hypothetical protein